MSLITPPQTMEVGDLVRVRKEWWPYFLGGEVGVILSAFCHRVCTKGGITSLSPEEGGPQYGMEWGYVAQFSDGPTQGVRLDSLSPVEIVG